MLCYYKHKYNKAMINYMIHENLFNVQNGGRQNEIEERVDKIYNEIQRRIEEENRTKKRRKYD